MDLELFSFPSNSQLNNIVQLIEHEHETSSQKVFWIFLQFSTLFLFSEKTFG